MSSRPMPACRRAMRGLMITIAFATVFAVFAGRCAAVNVGDLKAIVTAAEPTELEKKAAEELSGYLKKMYGVALPVEAREAIDAETTGVILLGEGPAVASGAVSEAELKKVRWDGYVIKVADGRIAIAGPRGLATLFGVAGFLEHLGARFYGPMETIPDSKGKPVEDFTLTDKPAWEFRRVGGDWKLRTSNMDLADPRKGADPELFTKEAHSDLYVDHTAGYLLPIDLYFKEHPEYFALINGKRSPAPRMNKDGSGPSDANVTPCLSNPDVIRICTERMLAWMEKNPEKRFFCMTYGDTAKFCECEKCGKLDVVPGQYMDRKLHWVNPVARAVARKHPDKVLLVWAYQTATHPPLREKPESNVIICYAPWYGQSTICRMHPYSICGRNVIASGDMEAWFRDAPGNLGVYDYPTRRPQLHAFPYKIKWWSKRGFRGIYQCGGPYRLRWLKLFIKARLLWDPELDPEKLQDEFCKAYYGPEAGKLMSEHFRDWYAEFVDTGTHRPREDPEFPTRALARINRIEELGGKALLRLKAFHSGRFSLMDFPWEQQEGVKEIQKYEVWYGKDLEEFKDRMSEGAWGEGPAFKPIEPEIGYQGYERGKLWLAKPHVARRGYKDDDKLTHIEAIVRPDSADARKTAERVQECIEAIYGVKLPIRGIEVNAETRGVIVVGRKDALASKLVSEKDLAAAGATGAVVRGRDGRIAVTAAKDANGSASVDALLYVLRMRHGGPRLGRKMPKSEVPVIREFTLIDWPPFGPHPEASGHRDGANRP